MTNLSLKMPCFPHLPPAHIYSYHPPHPTVFIKWPHLHGTVPVIFSISLQGRFPGLEVLMAAPLKMS